MRQRISQQLPIMNQGTRYKNETHQIPTRRNLYRRIKEIRLNCDQDIKTLYSHKEMRDCEDISASKQKYVYGKS